MKILIIALLGVFLIGCSIPPFKPTENRTKVTLTIIIDDDLSWMGQDYGKWKRRGNATCDGNNCIVWVPSIKTLDDKNFRIWGKVLAHVWGGDYHGNIKDIY